LKRVKQLETEVLPVIETEQNILLQRAFTSKSEYLFNKLAEVDARRARVEKYMRNIDKEFGY